MDQGRLNQLWSDPRNHAGNVYRCKDDPRVVVPKREPGTGWTLNFAHAGAWWVLASIPLALLLPVIVSLLVWPGNAVGAFGAFLLGGALVVTGSLWLNARVT